MVLSAFVQIGKLALLAAAAGAGPFVLLVPARWRHGWLALPLLLNCGLGLVAIIGVHAIYNNHTVGSAVPISITVSGACFAVVFIHGRRRAIESGRAFCREISEKKFGAILICCGSVLAIWPGIQAGGEQPYRIGVDEFGYAITAQYLRDGGTKENLEREIQWETGQQTLSKALTATSTSLSFNVNIASEFILKSQRSGYPGLIASLLEAAGVKWVHSGQCLLLLFPIWLTIALTAVFLTEDIGLAQGTSLLWSLAVGLNCNLLNVVHEGQQAQVFTTAFTGVILMLWWRWRKVGREQARSRKMLRPGFGLGVFSFAVVGATFSEHIMVLGTIGVFIVLIDAIATEDRINWGNLVVIMTCVTGLLILGRYSLEWVPFVFRHVRNVAGGGGGWPQPQWALPVDIVGYTNIYSSAVSDFIGREWWVELPLGILSVALVELAIWTLFVRRIGDISFLLAPVIFVTLIFCKSFYWDHIHNYNYMKAYTLLMMPIVALHAMSVGAIVQYVSEHRPAGKLLSYFSRATLLMPAWIILMGFLYLDSYEQEARTVPRGAEILSGKQGQDILRNACVVIGGSGGIGNFMLGAYTQLSWLNLDWADPFLPPHSGKQILFLALKRDLLDPESISKRFHSRMLLENADVLLFDTGQRVEVPSQQVGRPGLEAIKTTNSAKPLWPVTLIPVWAKIVSEVLHPAVAP